MFTLFHTVWPCRKAIANKYEKIHLGNLNFKKGGIWKILKKIKNQNTLLSIVIQRRYQEQKQIQKNGQNKTGDIRLLNSVTGSVLSTRGDNVPKADILPRHGCTLLKQKPLDVNMHKNFSFWTFRLSSYHQNKTKFLMAFFSARIWESLMLSANRTIQFSETRDGAQFFCVCERERMQSLMNH